MKLSDPFKILTPNERWAPTQSQMDAFQNAYEKLLPPLVYKIRLAVAKWRDEDYKGASETSKSLIEFLKVTLPFLVVRSNGILAMLCMVFSFLFILSIVS